MNKSATRFKITVIIVVIFSSLYLFGSSKDSFEPDVSNPFHDIFNLYYSNGRAKAIQLLKKQFDNKYLKNQAYINYGLIFESEGNYPEAEKFYRKALNNNEKSAITYLYNLYNKMNSPKEISLLSKISDNAGIAWIQYEKAVNNIASGDINKALEHLTIAVENGFSSEDLIINDPAFGKIKNSPAFEQLLQKIRGNQPGARSMNKSLTQVKSEYENNKPYGLINQLGVAALYERTGRDEDSLKILSSLIETAPAFRDKSIALYWLARINAKKNNRRKAEKYLKEFISLISGQEQDKTGFKDVAAFYYKDIIMNDVYLKTIGRDLLTN